MSNILRWGSGSQVEQRPKTKRKKDINLLITLKALMARSWAGILRLTLRCF